MPPPLPKVVNGVYGPMTCCACHKLLKSEGLRFPKNPELRSKWVETIMKETPDYPGREDELSKIGLQLCPQHFESKMLIQKIEQGRKVFALKKGGYPTQFRNLSQRNGNGDDEEILICYESTATNDTKSRPSLTSEADPDIMPVDYPNSVKSTVPTASLADPEILPVEFSPNQIKSRLSSSSDADPEVLPLEFTPQQVKSRISTGSNNNSVAKVPESAVDDKKTFSTVQDSMTGESLISKNDEIPSISDFISLLRLKDDRYFEPWRLLNTESSVLFSLFDEDCKYLIQSFKVDENLKTSCFYHGQAFTDSRLCEILGDNFRLDTWTKFKKLILFLHTLTKEKTDTSMKLKEACKLIQECIQGGEKFGYTQKEIKKWKFSACQIESSTADIKRFPPEILQWALSTYNVNRQGYTKIYDSEFLTLPHPASVELYRRQLMRPKILVKKPYTPNSENGTVQHVQLNNTAATNHTSGHSGLSSNNNAAMEDDDCEITQIN